MVKSTIAVEDQIRGRGKGEGLPNGDVVDSNPVLGIPFFTKKLWIWSDLFLIWFL